MKKLFTLILMLLSVAVGVKAKTVFVATSGDNSDGSTWAKALTSIPNNSSTAVAAGDSVFIKAGTYSLSQSTAGWACLATKADVNYLGGFAGTEANSAQRSKSDLDNNGIIEPWEFTSVTTLSLTATNNAYGLYITTNTTTQRVFDGFKITGSFDAGTLNAAAGNTMVRIFGYTNFRNNTLENCTLTATGTLGASYTKGTLILMGNGSASTVFNQVDNCLFENNTSTVTAGSTQTDAQQSPFVHMDASYGSGRNLFSNCVIRKNRITVNFSATSLTSNYNTRGLIFSMSIQGNGSHTAWNAFKNNLVYNNDVTYTSGSVAHSLGNGGLVYPYSTNYNSEDSILNNTIANNKMTKIGTAIKVGIHSTASATWQYKGPFHKVINNVLYNNTNYNGSATSAQNLGTTAAPDNTTAGILIANNYSTSGGLTNTTGANPNIVSNVVDLSTTNADLSKGAWFAAPTANTLIGYSTDASVATSRWTIGSSSYLKAKGYSLADKSDKAGFAFASTPSVGAYEQYTPTITGATTTSVFISTYGAASDAQQFNVSGTKLYGNLVATAPTGYEVSTNGSSYGATATISRGTGNPSGIVYMRLKSTNNAGNYNAVNTVLSTTDGTSVNISTPASGNTVSPKALTIGTPSIASKQYNGTATSGTVTPGSLSGFVGSETVVVASAVGTYPDANVGTGKTATIAYTLANGTNGGLSTNYSLANGSATGDITAISTPINSDSDLGNAATLPGTDVSVAAGNVLTVNNSTTVRSITVSPGAKLTINDGVSLTATNGITLQNTAGGTASFVDSRVADNPSAIAGTVEQAITETNRNWYVAVPVSGKLASDITLSGAKIVQRNEALSRWDDVLSGTTLTPGVGYIAVASATSGTTSWSLNGNLNSGKVEVPVTRSGASSTGFNLLGNPYPSYLNWEQVLNLNSTNASLLQSSIWYRTKSGASYAFQTYNSAGRVATPTSTTGYIPPMQAFWVRASAAGTVTFTNAMRSHGDGASNKLKAPKVNTQQIIRLQVSNAVVTDEAVVYIDQNAQNAFDKYDTEKMFNNVASQPELYTKAGIEKLVINGLNEISDNQEIPLGLTYTQGGDLKLKLTELSNFDSNTKVYLRDKQENSETELTAETEYAFSSTAATSNNESRFSLLFKAPGVTTGTTNANNERVSVFVNTQNQITIIAKPNSNYAIYNAVGQLIENGTLNSELKTQNSKLVAGVYVVKVNNQSTRVVVK